MKKITLIFLLIFGLTYSQNLTVESGASLTIEKTGTATVGGNFSNSGTVTMNSDADEFSAIKISGSTSGSITYNRYVNAVGTDEWDLIGSPVDGLSINTFASTNDSPLATNGSQYAIGQFDNSQTTVSDAWTNFTTSNIATSGSFNLGQGYQMGTDSGATLAFTGTISSSDVTRAIIDNSSSGYRWNLVANPYPSYLYLNSAADGTNNLITINTSPLEIRILTEVLQQFTAGIQIKLVAQVMNHMTEMILQNI